MFHTKGDDYEIEKKDNEFCFTGDMMSPEYDNVAAFFEQTFTEIKEDNIVFNFERLLYLNTPGIGALCRAIAKLPRHKKVHIKINKNISWQSVSVEGFSLICPGKVEVKKVEH